MSEVPMKKQALLIGINEYQILPELKFARQDAEAVEQALKENYGFTDDEVILLTDAKPGLFKPTTRQIIEIHLERLADQDLDLFIFGFWGHGLFRNGQRYFCPLDAISDNIEDHGLPFDVLQRYLSNIKAKNTCMILDCCQRIHDRGESETFTADDQIIIENAARDIVLKKQEKEPEFHSNAVILNSCKKGQAAYEWDCRQHGIFTAHLLDAMNRRFDSVSQIVGYVSRNVEKTAMELGKLQTPLCSLEGDILLPVTSESTESPSNLRFQTPVDTEPAEQIPNASEPQSSVKNRKSADRSRTKNKKGGIIGIIVGSLAAVVVFPYLMAFIEMTTGAHSSLPIPAPGVTSTYKYIPDWWPDWAMFLFPGRTAPEDYSVSNGTANEYASANDSAPIAPANENAEESFAPSQSNDVSADDGAFDPDAFLSNDDSADNTPMEPGVINAPVYTSADVSEAVSNVGMAFKAAMKIDDSVYAALNDMAEKSTFVDTSAADDQLKDAMSKVKTAMRNFGTKSALSSALSEKWAARVNDESDNDGVMLVGTLSDVSERDGYQVNTITVEGLDSSVEIVGHRRIKSVIGDKVVVCGKRISNPEKNLGGFTSSGLPVIWGGIVIKAEKR